MIKLRKFTILCVLLLCAPLSLHSAVILQVKGKKALVDLEGMEAAAGEQFDAINLYGRTLGRLRLEKVKSGKAIAVLLKGKMDKNWVLEPAKRRKKTKTLSGNAKNTTQVRSSSSSPGLLKSAGILAGLQWNRIAMSQTQTVTGLSFNGALFVDIPFSLSFAVRTALGWHQLKAEGAGCQANECRLLVNYPAVQMLFKYSFLKNKIFDMWAGAGGSLFYPIPLAGRTLRFADESFKGLHGALSASTGANIFVNKQEFYIPIQIGLDWQNPFVFSLRPTKGTRGFQPLYLSFKAGVAFSF